MAPNAKVTHVDNGVSNPAEALKEGGINETTPPEQRDPVGTAPKVETPIKRENGSFAPAQYPVVKNGHKFIRRDR